MVILEPTKIKSVTTSIFSTSIYPEVMGQDAGILGFVILSFRQLFYSPLSQSSGGSLVPFSFLPLEWYHLHISGC